MKTLSSHVALKPMLSPRSLLTGALLLAVAGCANYSGIDSKAELRKPETFATQQTFAGTTGDWPAAQWWRQFQDAQLNALMDEAMAHSPSLEAAAARVRAARAYTGVTRSAEYPVIDASGDISYQKFSKNWIYPSPYGGASMFNNTLHLNASYDLDFWGRNRAGVKSAVSQQREAEAEQQSTALLLTSSIAKTYIEFDRLLTERDVVARSLQQREKIFALTQQRLDAGLDNRAELKQAESELPVLRGQLAQVDEAIGAVRNALAELVGAGPDRGLKIERPHLALAAAPIALPPNLPVDLLGRRPDIVAARWQAEAAQQEVAVAKAEFYPNISLTGYIGASSLGLDKLLRSGSEENGIGPALSLPIFAGGRLRQNLKRQYAAYDSAVANYNTTLTAALRDVADQLNGLHWLQARQREQRNAAAIAHTALDLATARYKAGLGNYLSVLNAETTVLAQDRLGVELGAQAMALRVNLIKALGGGYDTTTQTAANN